MAHNAPQSSGFACMECGRKFRTLKAAEKAADKGCPKCGGVDIDINPMSTDDLLFAARSASMP